MDNKHSKHMSEVNECNLYKYSKWQASFFGTGR